MSKRLWYTVTCISASDIGKQVNGCNVLGHIFADLSSVVSYDIVRSPGDWDGNVTKPTKGTARDNWERVCIVV